jgi:hypothetical protein
MPVFGCSGSRVRRRTDSSRGEPAASSQNNAGDTCRYSDSQNHPPSVAAATYGRDTADPGYNRSLIVAVAGVGDVGRGSTTFAEATAVKPPPVTTWPMVAVPESVAAAELGLVGEYRSADCTGDLRCNRSG